MTKVVSGRQIIKDIVSSAIEDEICYFVYLAPKDVKSLCVHCGIDHEQCHAACVGIMFKVVYEENESRELRPQMGLVVKIIRDGPCFVINSVTHQILENTHSLVRMQILPTGVMGAAYKSTVISDRVDRFMFDGPIESIKPGLNLYDSVSYISAHLRQETHSKSCFFLTNHGRTEIYDKKSYLSPGGLLYLCGAPTNFEYDIEKILIRGNYELVENNCMVQTKEYIRHELLHDVVHDLHRQGLYISFNKGLDIIKHCKTHKHCKPVKHDDLCICNIFTFAISPDPHAAFHGFVFDLNTTSPCPKIRSIVFRVVKPEERLVRVVMARATPNWTKPCKVIDHNVECPTCYWVLCSINMFLHDVMMHSLGKSHKTDDDYRVRIHLPERDHTEKCMLFQTGLRKQTRNGTSVITQKGLKFMVSSLFINEIVGNSYIKFDTDGCPVLMEAKYSVEVKEEEEDRDDEKKKDDDLLRKLVKTTIDSMTVKKETNSSNEKSVERLIAQADQSGMDIVIKTDYDSYHISLVNREDESSNIVTKHIVPPEPPVAPKPIPPNDEQISIMRKQREEEELERRRLFKELYGEKTFECDRCHKLIPYEHDRVVWTCSNNDRQIYHSSCSKNQGLRLLQTCRCGSVIVDMKRLCRDKVIHSKHAEKEEDRNALLSHNDVVVPVVEPIVEHVVPVVEQTVDHVEPIVSDERMELAGQNSEPEPTKSVSYDLSEEEVKKQIEKVSRNVVAIIRPVSESQPSIVKRKKRPKRIRKSFAMNFIDIQNGLRKAMEDDDIVYPRPLSVLRYDAPEFIPKSKIK